MEVRDKYSRIVRTVVCSFFLIFVITDSLPAQYNAGVIKAAYIERITRFIEWPLAYSVKDSTVFVIGVYKETEFYKTLSEVFKDKTIKDRKVRILIIENAGQIKSCDICFISARGKPEIKKFISMANDNGVLIMSDSKDFGEAGIHINFYVEDEKLKFEINKKSIDSGNFRVSSLLMKSSKII